MSLDFIYRYNHKVLEYTNNRIFKEKLDEKKIGIKPQPGSIKEP